MQACGFVYGTANKHAGLLYLSIKKAALPQTAKPTLVVLVMYEDTRNDATLPAKNKKGPKIISRASQNRRKAYLTMLRMTFRSRSRQWRSDSQM